MRRILRRPDKKSPFSQGFARVVRVPLGVLWKALRFVARLLLFALTTSPSPASCRSFRQYPGILLSGKIGCPAVTLSPQLISPVRQPLFHCPGRQGGIEGFRVEAAPYPLQQLLVPLMLGVLDGLHEVGVAPDAAAVLGRA